MEAKSIFEFHPLPWRLDEYGYFVDKNGNLIHMYSREFRNVMVRAVNSHEELVKVCERAFEKLENGGHHWGTLNLDLKSALARAKGE